MKIPKACLFDLDGLLLDTETLHGKAWFEASAAFGKELSNDQLLSLRGKRRIDCAQQVEKWIGTQIGTDQIISIQQPIAKKLLKNSKPMPGAETLVRWCHEHEIPMALVTSSTKESIAIKSAPHPWLSLIKTRVLGDDPSLLAGKPSPEPFLLAAKYLDVEANACWAMEDSTAGTAAALAAGCQVWVLQENSVSQESEPRIEGHNPIKINNLGTITKLLQMEWDSLKANQ